MRQIVKADEITSGQLEALRSEAETAGDQDMVATIDDALESDCQWERAEAMDECARVMQAAVDANDEVGQ